MNTLEKIPDTGLQYPEITFSPEPGFQLCPKCNGEGVVYNPHSTTASFDMQCPVCVGKMIINRQTGKPPEI